MKKNREFQAIYKGRNSVAVGAVVMYTMNNESADLPRVGFSASKKIGNAVKRNRARRLMKEAARIHLSRFAPGVDYIFVARKSINESSYAQVEAGMLSALAKSGARTKPT